MSALRNPLFASLRRKLADTAALPETEHRALVLRAQYDDVGDFLMRHQLDLGEGNYAIARAHLAGDPVVCAQVTGLLREHGHLTDAMLARLAKPGEHGLSPEAVGEMAERMARELAECVRIIAASHSSGVEYRAALSAEVTGFSADPLGALDRLIRLTSGVVEATRTMEEQLEGAREEAERLRTNLRRAQRDADRDHLTGLPNRRHFEMRLNAIPRDGPVAMAVALCDIDDFKHVNDQHGHGTGDRVLKFVGRLLRSELGDHATVARYGGEEFVCLFEGYSVEDAAALVDGARAELVSRSLASRQTGRAIGRLTFSAGVAEVVGDGRTAVRRADTALYAAKRAGKNQVALAPDDA